MRKRFLGALAGAEESFSGYCRLAAQAMLQAAMEHEVAEFIGRSSCRRLAQSLEECLTCVKLPENHRRRVRTTDSLERLIEAARRRTKAPGGERAGLALICAVTVDVARRRRGIKTTPADLEILNALRAEVAPLTATA